MNRKEREKGRMIYDDALSAMYTIFGEILSLYILYFKLCITGHEVRISSRISTTVSLFVDSKKRQSENKNKKNT